VPKAYSYIRFSSPEQARGDSYRRQKTAAERFCVEHGLELAASKEYTFFDKGLSAYKARHLDDEGQLRRFLDLVEAGTIEPGSYLLVESLDRLSREKITVALPRFMDLLNKGIAIVTLSDGRVYSAASESIAMELIVSISIMIRAYDESSTKGQRVSAAWSNKKQLARSEMKPLGKACPYWLELRDGQYTPIPERVKAISFIFDMTINGYGQVAVSKELNQRGIPIFGSRNRNQSGAWGTSSINKILGNRALLGEYQPTHMVGGARVADGDPITGFYPVVLSEEVFYQAQAARSQRRNSRASKQTKTFNFWQGVARCHQCGGAMHLINKGKPPKGYTYLQCHSAKKGVCSNSMVRIERSEIIFRELLAKVGSLSLLQGTSGEIQRRLTGVEGRLVDMSAKLESAIASYEEFPSSSAARILQSLEQQQSVMQAERKQLQEQLASERITSKEDFFSQLDLVSFEGRAAANGLLKRLGIYGYFRCNGPGSAVCWVASAPEIPTSSNFDHLLFWIHLQGDKLTLQAADDSIWSRQVEQGELSEDQAALEMEEGVSWHWFGGRLSRG